MKTYLALLILALLTFSSAQYKNCLDIEEDHPGDERIEWSATETQLMAKVTMEVGGNGYGGIGFNSVGEHKLAKGNFILVWKTASGNKIFEYIGGENETAPLSRVESQVTNTTVNINNAHIEFTFVRPIPGQYFQIKKEVQTIMTLHHDTQVPQNEDNIPMPQEIHEHDINYFVESVCKRNSNGASKLQSGLLGSLLLLGFLIF